MHWLPLTLLCAFSLATADALTKRHFEGLSGRDMTLLRFGWAAVWLAPVLAVQPWPQPPAAFWGWVAALVPLEILAMALYMRAILVAPLAHTLPYLAFTPVFVTLVGDWLLGERIPPLGLLGVSLVTLGAYLLNLEHLRATNGWAPLGPLRAILRERGPRLMLAVAALYGVTSVLGKGAVRLVPPLWFGAFYFVLLGVVVLVTLRPREGLHRLASCKPRAAAAVGLATAVMVLTHFLAVERVEVAYMIAVKRTSLLFGILYGWWWFGERHLARHLLAGGVMVAGVAILAW
ncbi:MAG TPA: EamA family transporter [Chromatiales bacterium]|nr:EamA family transporter [Chromatiales bacterium]